MTIHLFHHKQICKEAAKPTVNDAPDPDPSNRTSITSSSDEDDDFPHAKETFFHTSRIKDSIAVQKHHGTNDCEVHEENPHLQDFMIPHHSVHVRRLDDEEEDAVTVTIAETAAEQPVNAAAAATTRRSCLRPETKTSYYNRPKTEKSKRRIHFGDVFVRDYEMILGDNPCVTYGPPVTLDWDYVEFNPLPVDEYEFHHPPRRTIREMGMNYYRRKELLTLAGHSEEELKMAKKEVKKCKSNRYMTRQLASYPVVKMQATIESALRKCRRLLKDDHWKTERHLFVQ
uniref:Uncharacterized protein n=1 Tax=Skeletonema marinoi TaxID=267567 RepID=A0A7S2Q2P1_9STRA|mmetsp:Transcript_8493/g.14412  ORF Transcript_8493/g.14412 Transcript_8493/m.14412 type:complete len:286 (+) Transcript_8493:66-923(+)